MKAMKTIAIALVSMFPLGCGDNDPGQPEPDDPDVVEITMTAYSAAALAANGGMQHVAFVAYQDGDGPWQAMSGEAGVYKAKIQSRKYGIAVGCAPFQRGDGSVPGSNVSFYHATVDEITTQQDFGCYQLLRPYRVTGTVVGDPVPEGIVVAGRDAFASPDLDNRFAFDTRSYRTPIFGYSEMATFRPTGIVRVDSVDPTAGAPVQLDFSKGVDPIPQSLTLPSGFVPTTIFSSLRVAGDIFLFMRDRTVITSYLAPPASLLRGGDLIRVNVGAGGAPTLSSAVYLAAPGPVSLTFATPFPGGAPTVSAGTDLRPIIAFSVGGHGFPIVDYQFSAVTSDGQSAAAVVVSLSLGWLGGDGPVTYQVPDLSQIPGWSPVFALQPRSEISWSMVRLELTTRNLDVSRKEMRTSYLGSSGSYCGNRIIEPAFEQCDPPDATTCSNTCQTRAP
jgi:hypothetical protein